jgi:hypothetical protein
MKTFYAPAIRANDEVIANDFENFRQFDSLADLINGLPYIVVILNKQRQLVFCNQYLVELLGAKDMQSLLGLRPGELINCIHATETSAGCGTSESCRYCGAVNAIMKCLNTGKRSQGECRIISRSDESGDVSYDFFVAASPFRHHDQEFVILSFNDISDQKRRKVLEKLFFHDILNTAGGLKGFLEFLNAFPDDKDRAELLKVAMSLSDQMIDEIVAQRELLAAEQGELTPRMESVYCKKMIDQIKMQIEHHPVALEKTISIKHTGPDVLFLTDPVLIRRVLLNMVKNALEASVSGQTVTLWYEQDDKSKTVTFFVHNLAEMSHEVKSQIFQRSFSTKSSSRGVGTYSIKLFGEKYLKGKVSFNSTKLEGTTFKIMLPMAP